MTKADSWRILKQMELIREDIEESEGENRTRLEKEYAGLWSLIKPYVEGHEKYKD